MSELFARHILKLGGRNKDKWQWRKCVITNDAKFKYYEQKATAAEYKGELDLEGNTFELIDANNKQYKKLSDIKRPKPTNNSDFTSSPIFIQINFKSESKPYIFALPSDEKESWVQWLNDGKGGIPALVDAMRARQLAARQSMPQHLSKPTSANTLAASGTQARPNSLPQSAPIAGSPSQVSPAQAQQSTPPATTSAPAEVFVDPFNAPLVPVDEATFAFNTYVPVTELDARAQQAAAPTTAAAPAPAPTPAQPVIPQSTSNPSLSGPQTIPVTVGSPGALSSGSGGSIASMPGAVKMPVLSTSGNNLPGAVKLSMLNSPAAPGTVKLPAFGAVATLTPPSPFPPASTAAPAQIPVATTITPPSVFPTATAAPAQTPVATIAPPSIFSAAPSVQAPFTPSMAPPSVIPAATPVTAAPAPAAAPVEGLDELKNIEDMMAGLTIDLSTEMEMNPWAGLI